jgi:hypothetical protein
MDFSELREEIRKRFEVVEKTVGMDFGSLNHHNKDSLYHTSDAELELMMKDCEEFEQLRLQHIDDVIALNKKIKHKKDMKKIKKATMKSMIEGPALHI